MTGQPPPYWNSRGWQGNWEEQFRSQAGVDPETGLLTGFSGSVPGPLGLMYQDMHTQATARARQNFMEQGIGWQEGALGLLQSFRPGGGAYAAADAYSRLAGLHFQRASMTQPIDYLSDFRRHEAFMARRRARKAERMAGFGSIAGSAAAGLTAMIPGVGPVLAPFVGNAVGSAVSGGQVNNAGTLGVSMLPGQQQGQGGPGVQPQRLPMGSESPTGQGMEMGGMQQPGGQQKPQQGQQQEGAPGQSGAGPEQMQQGAQMDMGALLIQLLLADLADDESWDINSAAIEHQAMLRRPPTMLGAA